MALHPFTPDGVQDKLYQLYNLPDEELFEEARAIDVGFVEWMKHNFTLGTAERDFLDKIKEEAINYYGSQCALCFRHRLDIILIDPISIADHAKWPETSNTIKVAADNLGQMVVNGSLVFRMIYK